MHVLIIEDEYLIAAMLQDDLTALGYDSFEIVDTQAEAIAASERMCPDLIAADDQLTEGSGIDAVAHICASKIIPVIYILGDPSQPRDILPYAYTMAKPFTIQTIRDAVRDAVRQANIHKEKIG